MPDVQPAQHLLRHLDPDNHALNAIYITEQFLLSEQCTKDRFSFVHAMGGMLKMYELIQEMSNAVSQLECSYEHSPWSDLIGVDWESCCSTYNITAAIALLDLSPQSYAKIATRMPSLLATPALTLQAKVNAFAETFGIPLSAALKVMQRAPQLMAMAPQTILGNIEATAALLAISTETWRATILKRPSITGYRPETIRATVNEIAVLCHSAPQDVIAVLLKYPAIFGLSTKSMQDKLPHILAVCHALGYKYSAADVLRECPLAFTYATERLMRRLRLAQLGLGPASIMNLLSLSDVKAAPLLKRSAVLP